MFEALVRLSLLFFPILMVYGIYSHSLEDFIKPLSFAFVAALLYMGTALVRWGLEGFKRPRLSAAGELAVFLVLDVILCVLAYAFYLGLLSCADAFAGWAARSAGATTLLALALGVVLFLVRLRFRCIYGASEVAVGLTLAGSQFDALAMLTNANRPLLVGFLTAAVYLIVRGLDNVHQGMTKEPMDPIGGRFLRWLVSKTAPSNKPDHITAYPGWK